METKGNCKHGEFVLADGCPQCIAEKYLISTALPNALGTDIQIISYYNEAVKLQKYAEDRVIKTLEDAKIATDDLTVIARLKKTMEARRKEELKPHDEARKAIQANYDHWMTPVLAADTITRQKWSAWDAEQKRIRQEQEMINQKRQEAAEAEMKLKGELSEPVNLVEVIEAPKKVVTDMGSTSTMKIRKYRVTNFAELPDQYKIENSALLNKVVKAGIPSIPGVEIYVEESLVVRPK